MQNLMRVSTAPGMVGVPTTGNPGGVSGLNVSTNAAGGGLVTSSSFSSLTAFVSKLQHQQQQQHRSSLSHSRRISAGNEYVSLSPPAGLCGASIAGGGSGGGMSASGSGLSLAAAAAAAVHPHPRVEFHMYKYMWSTGDRERSLRSLEVFMSNLERCVTCIVGGGVVVE